MVHWWTKEAVIGKNKQTKKQQQQKPLLAVHYIRKYCRGVVTILDLQELIYELRLYLMPYYSFNSPKLLSGPLLMEAFFLSFMFPYFYFFASV